VREMPAATANHWDAMPLAGRPRTRDSHDRQRQMTKAICRDEEWCAPPVINRFTCLTVVMNPATGLLRVRGWQHSGPVTAELALSGAL